MKRLIPVLLGVLLIVLLIWLPALALIFAHGTSVPSIRTNTPSPGPSLPTNSLINVEVDILQTKTLWPALGQGPIIDEPSLTWPEDRWIIGWSPWIGFNRGMVMEGHCYLIVDGVGLLLRGPHKESPGQLYDLTNAEFFPAGCGRFVPAGHQVSLQFLVANTGSAPGTNAATANIRVFSVKK